MMGEVVTGKRDRTSSGSSVRIMLGEDRTGLLRTGQHIPGRKYHRAFGICGLSSLLGVGCYLTAIGISVVCCVMRGGKLCDGGGKYRSRRIEK